METAKQIEEMSKQYTRKVTAKKIDDVFNIMDQYIEFNKDDHVQEFDWDRNRKQAI